MKLDKVLLDGVNGKLDYKEQRALRYQLLVHQFDSRRQTVLKLLKVRIDGILFNMKSLILMKYKRLI